VALQFMEKEIVNPSSASFYGLNPHTAINSTPLVDFPTVADVVQIDAALRYIKLVKHPVIEL
jgi:hypothetical protein